MNEFDKISEDLFNKIRGRFPNVTIGAADGKVTNQPNLARFFDFDYNGLGKVSVAIDEDDGLTIIYSKDFMQNEDELTKEAWYDFLKELRVFSKKRMLDYSVRDITKSNLNKRDYNFLAKTPEDGQMTESKLYGTSRISYQKVGEARIVIKHTEGVNQESATGRTQKIGKIYIESADGERFRYPFKHLSGARAMARHVAEGGNTYDDFGKHIVGLSEEMAKLRKFKNYMGRSAVMAESLAGYVDVVKERISTVKKTIASLQKPAYYAEAFAAFETPIMEDVPADVKENWIDQLTIKQFNEELSDVFPYIYKLVSEATKATELGPEELVDEASKGIEAMKKAGNAKADAEAKERAKKDKSVEEGPFKGVGKTLMKRKLDKQYKKSDLANFDKSGIDTSGKTPDEIGQMKSDYYHSHMDKADKAKKAKNRLSREEIALEQGFEEMMGQFGEGAMSDMHQDAQEMSKEEFVAKYGKSAGNDWENVQKDMETEAEQRTDEFLPALAIPALITAARVAAPKLAQIGAKILSKGAQGAATGARVVGKTALKNPGTTAAVGGGAYVGKKAGDAIDAVGDMADGLATSAGDILAKAEGGIEAIQGEISAFLGGGAVKQVAAMAAKYALPALAVVALLYGGKKVIDMLRSKDDGEMQTASIEEVAGPDKCWPGHRKVGTQAGTGKNKGKRVNKCKKIESEEEVQEAYIDTSKDAIEVLGALRGKGKAIERGQDDDQGNLANQYVSDVWDVYSFIEARTNGFSGLDKGAKAAIDAMMKLRGEAKKLETQPGSGKNARFGNQIVTALYPVMEYLYTTDFDRNKKEDDTDEGNAYAHAVKKAKMNGKKKGDKIDGPDGDEITLEKDEKTPLGEFILSYYDRESGEFPKGETAVLTMVEKDYGEQFIEPAKAFIEQVQALFDEYQMDTQPQQMGVESGLERMKELAGVR